jgi:hypothetical protein
MAREGAHAALQLQAVAAMTAGGMSSRHICMVICVPAHQVKKLRSQARRIGLIPALSVRNTGPGAPTEKA